MFFYEKKKNILKYNLNCCSVTIIMDSFISWKCIYIVGNSFSITRDFICNWYHMVSTALIFAISHFGFLYNISVKQFIFNAISIFFTVCFYYHITYLFITAKIDRLTKITLSPPTFSGEP